MTEREDNNMDLKHAKYQFEDELMKEIREKTDV
jgi:hypothetical protein